LADAGLEVAGADRGFTASHHLAITLADAITAQWAVGSLERAGIYVSATEVGTERGPIAALRLGTQELVRRGFSAADMPAIGTAIVRVLAGESPADVAPTVAALRQHRSLSRA
jgi:glycine hydroxymethyltransferase